MICQKCHKNEATVHIKNNINGKVSEAMLCHSCAEKENLTSFFKLPSDNLFSGFFSDSVFGSEPKIDLRKCSLCGSSARDLAATGKAGCAKCYDTFANELSKIIYGIHGNALHTGSHPETYQKTIELNTQIEKLKREQETAISEQNYEKAAELRDRIRELQNGSENNSK